MTASVHTAVLGAPSPSASRARIAILAAYAAATFAASVIFFAVFLALMINGSSGRNALFALVAGALSFSAMVLLQFAHWAVILIAKMRTPR